MQYVITAKYYIKFFINLIFFIMFNKTVISETSNFVNCIIIINKVYNDNINDNYYYYNCALKLG